MSRIGKKIITLPEKVTASVANNTVTVKGPLGELKYAVHPRLAVTVADGVVTITIGKASRRDNTAALWGTNRAIIANMVTGVTTGFTKQLDIIGVGYNAKLQGDQLVLALGFSHDVNVKVPKGLKVDVKKNTIVITGIAKDQVGQFAADLRALKKPEPYKGKGIRYSDEIVKKKEGKKLAGSEGGA